MIKRIGNECLVYKDYFKHIVNINIETTSISYEYDYMYSYEIYEVIKKDYFDSLFEFLTKESNINTLNLISLPQPNTKINLIKNNLINPINHLPTQQTKNVIVGQSLIKMSQILLSTKEEYLKAFEYLYSGYYSNSFLSSNVLTDNLQFDNLFHVDINKRNHRSKILLNYKFAKSIFSEIYLTYGGFDFGQFVLVSF